MRINYKLYNFLKAYTISAINFKLYFKAILFLLPVFIFILSCKKDQSSNNNIAPSDINLSSNKIYFDHVPGNAIGMLTTTDPDAGDTIFTYSIQPGEDQGSFRISDNTLKTGGSFNFNAKSSYNITIRSTDKGGMYFEKTFTINIVNPSENSAPTDIVLINNTIYESYPAGSVVGYFTTTDPDAGDTFTYSIRPGENQGLFSITGTSNLPKNNLATTGHFDYNAKSSYTITVRSTDRKGLYFEKTFTIKVLPLSKYANQILRNTNLIKDIKSDTTFSDYPGLEQTEIRYVNGGDSAMAIFFTKVDLSNPNITLEAVTPYDSLKYGNQTVRNMIIHKNRHTAAQNKKVIAAVNGDYFDVNGRPLGPVHKNGEIIMSWLDSIVSNTYYYLGVLKASKYATVGTAGNKTAYLANASNLQEVIGARYLLVVNGMDNTGKYNKNIEPRTAVGVLNNTEVVFLTVDGRQSSYSNGLSFYSMAKIFRAIGATDAVNHDGGGSTVLIVKDKNTDQYVIRNKPSGGGERAVSNGWAIMQQM